jgi:hypothetical protein
MTHHQGRHFGVGPLNECQQPVVITLGREFISDFEFAPQMSYCLFSSARRATKNPGPLRQLSVQPFGHAGRLSMAFV